jgi:hypothetical protein
LLLNSPIIPIFIEPTKIPTSWFQNYEISNETPEGLLKYEMADNEFYQALEKWIKYYKENRSEN